MTPKPVYIVMKTPWFKPVLAAGALTYLAVEAAPAAESGLPMPAKAPRLTHDFPYVSTYPVASPRWDTNRFRSWFILTNFTFAWPSNYVLPGPQDFWRPVPPLERKPYHPPLAEAKPPLLQPTLPPKVVEPGHQKAYTQRHPLLYPTLPPQVVPGPQADSASPLGPPKWRWEKP